MDFLKKVTDFFLKDGNLKKKEEQVQPNADNGKKLLKTLFTKTDGKSLTEFPYKWDMEFFPPLDREETAFMRKEILRWYDVYLENFTNRIIDAVVYLSLKPSSKNDWAVKFNRRFPEEFHLMIQDIVNSNLKTKIETIISNYEGESLVLWKPLENKDSWDPPQKELLLILRELSEIVIKHSQDSLEEQERIFEELMRQNGEEEPDKKTVIQETLYVILHNNKEELTKHCYDRLMLEYYSFSDYYGVYEKKFQNNLFLKYKDNFGIPTYNELVAKAYVHLDKFIKLHGKNELHKWIEEQWGEFHIFLENEYNSMTEEEINQLEFTDFNKYAFSIDYYTLMLFKIGLDGM